MSPDVSGADGADARDATDATDPTDLAAGADPSGEYRHLSVALRIGSLLLAAGASTNDVEGWMRRVAVAGGLLEVQSVVTMGILTMSATRRLDGQPITQMRVVGERTTDCARLAAVSHLVDRIEAGSMTLEAASDELARIEEMPPAYGPRFAAFAGGCSSAASTLLLGGAGLDAAATFAISLLVEPVLRLVSRSGLPRFFRALSGPLFATLLAVAAIALGLPIQGQFVIAGAILRFLPGSAFVAGMRDLIDGSIISGSARLAEALLLGSAVAMGTGAAIRLATTAGMPALTLGAVTGSAEGVALQAVAAGFACSFFALTLGIRRRDVVAVFVLGAAAWAIALVGARTSPDDVVPVFAAAVLVGAGAQLVARAARMPSIIWTVPAVLPLLPGLTIVRGILAITTVDGMLVVLSAVSAGFALGAGVAFGSILVAAVHQARLAAHNAVGPVLADARSGLGVVIRSADHAGENGPEPADAGRGPASAWRDLRRGRPRS